MVKRGRLRVLLAGRLVAVGIAGVSGLPANAADRHRDVQGG